MNSGAEEVAQAPTTKPPTLADAIDAYMALREGQELCNRLGIGTAVTVALAALEKRIFDAMKASNKATPLWHKGQALVWSPTTQRFDLRPFTFAAEIPA
jgi:hypothetical protein